MSLKTFHIIFVTTAVLLCLVFGGWCLTTDYAKAHAGYTAAGYASFGFGALLVVYEVIFLKNLKGKS